MYYFLLLVEPNPDVPLTNAGVETQTHDKELRNTDNHL